MLIHRTPDFALYFGSASDTIQPQEYLTIPAAIFFAKTESILRLMAQLNLQNLFFAHQVHGVQGIHVTPQLLSAVPAFTMQADFLHTTIPRIGIGVMTADCLPIILVDPMRKAAVIIHAGWRGAVNTIAQKALLCMYTAYGTRSTDVLVFLGPSARACCYQVGPEFVDIAHHTPHGTSALTTRKDQLFFDVPQLVCDQLVACGVPASSISHAYNLCTICDMRFYSHRRDGQRSGRQMTIVTLV